MTRGILWSCLLFLSLLPAAQCVGDKEPNVPTNGGAGGFGGVSPPSGCDAAQSKLVALGCQQATSPFGRSFGEVCTRAMRDGRDWHPACIAKITDCSQVEAAYRGDLESCR
jgi:hypothetical protein